MKKILLLCTLILTMSLSVNAGTPDIKKTVQTSTNVINNTVNKSTGIIDKTLNKTTDGIGAVYGDGKSVIQTVYSDSKEVVKYLTPKAERLLTRVAQKLETTSEQLWHILVKQQIVWSWCYLIGIVISILSWINFYYRFKVGKTDLDESGDWKTSNFAMCLITLVMSIVLSSYSFQHLVPMMTGFINPEFGALQIIVEVAKTLK